MSAFRPGNRITLLENGAQYFPALEQAIAAAQREVHLETYIYADDVTGRRIANALLNAVQRGVQVKVAVDGFGTSDYAGTVLNDLAHGGVHVAVYRPEIGRFNLRRNRLRRLHRKLAIVDGRVAFVGGINVIDDFNTPRQVAPRLDYAVRVEGPLLADIYPVVRRLWLIMLWSRLRYRSREPWLPPSPPTVAGEQLAAFIFRDNLGHRRDIEEAYLEAIGAARDDIIIANAYLFPGLAFRRALMHAAQRGVRVRLLLQGRVEYVLLHFATRALYGALLDAGVEIVEYHK